MSKPRKGELVLKRMLDVVGSLLGILLLSPLLLLLAIVVKATSRGSVFYRGKRTGLQGVPFRIFKFRSMVVGADRNGSPTTAALDPRITSVGHVLRRYKLDELPQLLNVLLGDMSFVGPRPEVTAYIDRMTAEEKVILTVRPGITDLASLRFHDLQAIVGTDDPEAVYQAKVLPEKKRLQMQYVAHWSLASDVSIVVRTLWLLLTKPLR